MNPGSPLFAINRDTRIARVRGAANARDFKARPGERPRLSIPATQDTRPVAVSPLFRCGTYPAAFAAQAVAQALKTPRATALEGALTYCSRPLDRARLIAVA